MYVRIEKRNTTRPGAILVIVLLALLVASMLGLGLIRTVLIDHRQTTVAGGQQQGFRLAEAGVQRAVRRLADNADYEGETWDVPAEILGSSRTAAVNVKVVKAAEDTNQRIVQVQVNLDDGRVQPIGYQQEYLWTVPTTKEEKQ